MSTVTSKNRDGELENFSAAEVRMQVAVLRPFEKEMKAFPGEQPDRELIPGNLGKYSNGITRPPALPR